MSKVVRLLGGRFLRSPADGSAVSKEFEPRLDKVLAAGIALGHALSSEEIATIPRLLWIGRPDDSKVPDIIGWSSGPFMISNRIKSWLDELEPGVQTFVPVEVRSKHHIAGSTEHGTYHMIVGMPTLDAIVSEGTEFTEGVIGIAGSPVKLLSSGHADACFADPAVVEGHHLWRLPKPNVSSYMCSEEFWHRLWTNKIRGWEAHKRFTFKPASQ